MNATLKTITLATIVAGAIVLAGCSSTDTTTTPTPPTSTATTAPAETTAPEEPDTDKPAEETPSTPEEVVTDIAELSAGDTLTADQAKVLNRSTGTGLRAYTMPSGEKVLVKKSEPLPEAVQAAEAEKLAAIDMPTGFSNRFEIIDKLLDAAGAATYATGKRSCVIMHAEYANKDINNPGTSLQWVAPGCPLDSESTVPWGHDKAAVIAEAQRRIAAEPDADEWALIIEQ